MGVKHGLGIIGFGGIANYHYVRLKEYDRIDVKGVFDLSPVACQRARERGLHVYESQEAMFADESVDVVLVSTTNDAHKYLAIEAMRRGKHVLCEKPATINSADLMEIMAVAKETGKVFTIDQNRRTDRDFVLVKRNLTDEYMGKIHVIESRVEGSRGMPGGWRTKKALGGGMMLDWGVHLIDQILYLLPDKVTQVYCKMLSIQHPEVDDNFHLTMMMESGIRVIIEVGTNHFVQHPRWYIMAEKGTLQIDDWSCKGRIVSCKDRENEWEERIVYTLAGPTKTMAPRSEKSTETIELSMPTDLIDSSIDVYNQFLDAVEGKAELAIKAEQALRVMKVMEAAFVSHEENRAVDVNI